MKFLSTAMLVFLLALGVVLLIGTTTVFSQTAPDRARAGRALALQELLGSIEGRPREAPRVFKTADGYLRFVGAPPSTHFAVVPGAPARMWNF